MLFGGRHEAAPAVETPPVNAYDQGDVYGQQQQIGMNCDAQSKEFLSCLEKTNDVNSCSYYLEQLKACQAAARPY